MIAHPTKKLSGKMTRRGELAKSGVPRRKDMLGSRAESMKLLVFYKSEEERWRGGWWRGWSRRGARDERWYRRGGKKKTKKRRQRLPPWINNKYRARRGNVGWDKNIAMYQHTCTGCTYGRDLRFRSRLSGLGSSFARCEKLDIMYRPEQYTESRSTFNFIFLLIFIGSR